MIQFMNTCTAKDYNELQKDSEMRFETYIALFP